MPIELVIFGIVAAILAALIFFAFKGTSTSGSGSTGPRKDSTPPRETDL